MEQICIIPYPVHVLGKYPLFALLGLAVVDVLGGGGVVAGLVVGVDVLLGGDADLLRHALVHQHVTHLAHGRGVQQVICDNSSIHTDTLLAYRILISLKANL